MASALLWQHFNATIGAVRGLKTRMASRAAIIFRDFCAGPRRLYEKGQESITMSIPEVP